MASPVVLSLSLTSHSRSAFAFVKSLFNLLLLLRFPHPNGQRTSLPRPLTLTVCWLILASN